MRTYFFLLAFLLLSVRIKAQELYVFTEPASNVPAQSIGLRLNNSFMENKGSFNYRLAPEIMFGLSKKIMFHVDAFFSTQNKDFKAEGGSVYVKYRFLSLDDVHKHFRMGAFARAGISNRVVNQKEINLNGYNSGLETGIVATQLLHKVALSSSISFIKALDNGNNLFPYSNKESKAIGYTFSAGKLMLPKTYKDYKQTNLNLMLEFLSQYNPGSGRYYIDAAPSVQLIFNSQSRVDVGYKKQLNSTLDRTAPNGLFIRLEHNLYNVY